MAQVTIQDEVFEIIDLPGTYSLYPNSLDEKVVIDELLLNPPDHIVVVGDSTNLHRSLLLFTQVSDLGYPISLVLNMIDELDHKGYIIETSFLSKEIGADVLLCNAKKGEGVEEIKQNIYNKTKTPNKINFSKSELFESFKTSNTLSYKAWHELVHHSGYNALTENIKRIETIDRYNQIEKICSLAVKPSKKGIAQKRRSEVLDKYLMHPVFGYFFFVLILFIVFQALFTIAAYPMDAIDYIGSNVSTYIAHLAPNNFLIRLFAEGIIPGISGIIMFIPQIALLYFFISLLEESGYIARVVFLMDKMMQKLGMSGKSIIPLMSGTACAIPAIAATRNISNYKERLITILTVPFMTCSARLPVYTILIATVIPMHLRGTTMLGLYGLGVLGAILTAFLLKSNIETQERSLLVMELPPYRIPTMYNLVILIKNAIVSFVRGAGKIIFSISIVLWLLASFGKESFSHGWHLEAHIPLEESFIGNIGKGIEPVVAPLGYDWKIGIALITSFAAREVFVGTLATIYSIEESEQENPMSIKEKLLLQKHDKTGQPVFTKATGLSLLIFYVFALQCMSTIAAIKRETNGWKWALSSFAYMGVLAYVSAWVVYRVFV